MDEKSWHGVREHLVWEFWVILLTMEPPSQSKTLVQIESKSADKVLDVDICSKRCFEGMVGVGEDRGRMMMICSQTWTGGGCITNNRLDWYTSSFRHQANWVLLLECLLCLSEVSKVTFILVLIVFIQANNPLSMIVCDAIDHCDVIKWELMI